MVRLDVGGSYKIKAHEAFLAAHKAGLDLKQLGFPHKPVRAGLPHFAVGDYWRDKLLTDRAMLPWVSEPLRRDLDSAAFHQGKRLNWRNEETPGAIPHWICREDELGREWFQKFQWGVDILESGERWVRYYRAADAPMLFIIGAYDLWAAEGRSREIAGWYRQNVARTIAWMFEEGGLHEFGFMVQRPKRNPAGLTSCSWRDGFSNYFGFRFPVAGILEQGFAYDALLRAAELAEAGTAIGYAPQSLRDTAAMLQKEVNERFWWPEEEYYYFALHGVTFRPVKRVVPEPLMALASGIIPEARRRAVVDRVFHSKKKDLWTPFGIRSLSKCDPAFRPNRYFTGAIWPSPVEQLVYEGLDRYGFEDEANLLRDAVTRSYLASGMIAECHGASTHENDGEIRYLRGMQRFGKPANEVQAWAAAAVFRILYPRLSKSEQTFLVGKLLDRGA